MSGIFLAVLLHSALRGLRSLDWSLPGAPRWQGSRPGSHWGSSFAAAGVEAGQGRGATTLLRGAHDLGSGVFLRAPVLESYHRRRGKQVWARSAEAQTWGVAGAPGEGEGWTEGRRTCLLSAVSHLWHLTCPSGQALGLHFDHKFIPACFSYLFLLGTSALEAFTLWGINRRVQ